jgi:hypothetical protein
VWNGTLFFQDQLSDCRRFPEFRRYIAESAASIEGLRLAITERLSSLYYVNYHQEILRYLPAQATAAAFVPIILLAFNKLSMQRTVHRQRDLREKVVALNVFIGSMNEFPDESGHYAACLQDAEQQRGLLLTQLESLNTQKSRASYHHASRSVACRFFLLYAPSGPFAWALHGIFFSS